MRKSKEKTAEEIQKRNQPKAKALLNNPDYIKEIREYEKLLKKQKREKKKSAIRELDLEEVRKANKICDKFSLEFPYPLDELEAIADGKTFFIGGLNEVDITQSEPDEEGFLHFKIKAGASRYIIHYILDLLLDSYSSNDRKRRFRKENIKAFEVWEEWQKSALSVKKGFPQIAKKLKINLSTVKTRWYKSYFLVYRKPYNQNEVKKQAKKAGEELCPKCTDVKCYKQREGHMEWIPCAEYLNLAGKEYLREKKMSDEDLESYQDYLSFKNYRHSVDSEEFD